VHQEKENDIFSVVTIEIADNTNEVVRFLLFFIKEFKATVYDEKHKDVFHGEIIAVFTKIFSQNKQAKR